MESRSKYSHNARGDEKRTVFDLFDTSNGESIGGFCNRSLEIAHGRNNVYR